MEKEGFQPESIRCSNFEPKKKSSVFLFLAGCCGVIAREMRSQLINALPSIGVLIQNVDPWGHFIYTLFLLE